MDQSRESMELCITQLWRKHQCEWSLHRDSTAHNTAPFSVQTSQQQYILDRPFTVTGSAVSLLKSPLKSTLNIKRVIKYRHETTVTVVVLIGVCPMVKVTLSSLAKIHTQQDQLDCWWWSDSWEKKKCGLDSWRPTALWWQCVVYGLYVCEQECAACVNETAPPAGSQPERKPFQRMVKIQNAGSWD